MTLADELERLADAATKRPWKADNHLGCKSIRGNKSGQFRQSQYVTEVCCTPGLADEDEDAANAALIVALANNLPAILRALRAQPDEAAVERAARAIFDQEFADVDWEKMSDSMRSDYRDRARAALAAASVSAQQPDEAAVELAARAIAERHQTCGYGDAFPCAVQGCRCLGDARAALAAAEGGR